MQRGATNFDVSYEVEKIDMASKVTDAILKAWIKVGRPEFDDTSTQFWFVIDQIVKGYLILFPQEFQDWMHDRALDLEVERSVAESARKGISQVGAYPPMLFRMLYAFFPGAKLSNKKFSHSFFNRYPQFKNTNYKI